MASRCRTTFTPKWFSYEKFVDAEELGSGTFGVVFKASYPSYPAVAIKMLKTSEEQRAELKKQLKLCHHPNIVKFYGETEDGRCKGIVLEYMDCGSLLSVIQGDRSYSKANAYNWMVQASNGLSYLHGEAVVHRDIKPANMLLQHKQSVLKICDFGLTEQQSKIDNTWTGTPKYMAPEIFVAVESRRQSYPVDVYALAISMWELLTMRSAFDHVESVTILRLSDMISKENVRPELTFREKELTTFIRRMWHTDQDMRPSMKEVSAFASEMEEKHNKTGAYVKKSNAGRKQLSETEMNEKMKRLSTEDSTPSSSNSSASRSSSSQPKSSVDRWMTVSGKVKTTLKEKKMFNELETFTADIDAVSREISNISRKQKVESVNKSVQEVKSKLQQMLDMITAAMKKYPLFRLLVDLDFEEETRRLSASVDEQAASRIATISLKQK